MVTNTQKYCNALKTYSACAGHGKAERNKSAANDYRLEITAEGGVVPDRETAIQAGVFNGPGSV